MRILDTYEQRLLQAWEEVFKKGQLTLWILLALQEGPKHMSEIKDFITSATGGTVSADDQSMYRALRRFYDTELVDFENEPNVHGPDHKVYSISRSGKRMLRAFARRNIVEVFYARRNQQLIMRTAQ